MDSRLDSLFRTTFQPARQTDTWQGIRREEPRHDGRKKGPHKESVQDDSEEDHATLSVLALHEFLKTLLVQSGEESSWTIAQTLPPEEDSEHAAMPVNTASANAARAYQTTAKSAPGGRIDFSERMPAAPVSTAPPLSLSAEELRIIHQLLVDIEELGRRGIAAIPLHPAESFLQSLVTGVREAAG